MKTNKNIKLQILDLNSNLDRFVVNTYNRECLVSFYFHSGTVFWGQILTFKDGEEKY